MSQKPEKQIRLDKLTKIKELGINPYPSQPQGDFVSIPEARQRGEGEKLAIVGRILSIRSHGKATFLDLTGSESKIQIYCKEDILEDDYHLVSLLDSGDYLWVKGELFMTHSQELTLKAAKLQLLSKALTPLPDSWQGLSDIETRYRQRALDFKINDTARHILYARARLLKTMRRFFDERDFLEVQTPILQPLAGGAAAKPFVTHYNILEADFYLRIAPELYLKRLIAGGFERVYEIGPCFRNEGLSHMHNPEFTSCEFYWAYKTYRDLITVTEELIKQLAQAILGTEQIVYQNQKIDLSAKWTICSFGELIEKETGINIQREKTLIGLKAAVKKAGLKVEEKDYSVWQELVDEVFKKIVRPKIILPTFVIDYPASLSPLAKRHEDKPELVQQFQLIMAGGVELVKAYSELNDPTEQEARFKEQMKLREEGWDEGQVIDKNYLEAMRIGMPPVAGWGMGIDRLLMILTNNYSIKEVIPFPTLRPQI